MRHLLVDGRCVNAYQHRYQPFDNGAFGIRSLLEQLAHEYPVVDVIQQPDDEKKSLIGADRNMCYEGVACAL